MDDRMLHQQVDACVDAFRDEIHQCIDQISLLSYGLVLLELEKQVFGLLMRLGAALVAAFVEEVHRNSDWIGRCQAQARESGLRNSGWRFTMVYSLFGGRQRLRTPYAVADRRGRPGRRRGRGRRGPTGSGSYPVLEGLGCRANATPALLSEVGSQMGWGPSEDAAQSRLRDRGIRLNHKTMRRMFSALADEALDQRTQTLQQGQLPAGSRGETLAGKRAVICFDAGRVRSRRQHRGRRKQKGYHGFDGPWKAPRLLVIYALDEKGHKQRQELPLYDGVLTSAVQLLDLLKQYLIALEAPQAELLVFLADGAPENWDIVTQLIQSLALSPQRVVEVLDWAHAVEHLTNVLNACGNLSEKQRKGWLDKQCKRLKKGQLSAVLADFYTLCRGRRAATIRKEIAYFEEHAYRMRYDHFQRIALPIGSGAVESAIRRVVNLRMKGNGIFWNPDSIQRMLYIRCLLLSGRWQAFIRALLCNETPATQTPSALPLAA